MDGDGILDVHDHIDGIGNQELLGGARIAEDEGEVVLVHALDGNREVLFRFQRNIVGTVRKERADTERICG